MKSRIKMGVVGCGYWGPNLIRNFRSLADCDMALVCDVERARLDHVCGLYPGLTGETTFDAALNGCGLDAIAIATPVRLHHDLAKRSLLAGKHTFIEKPMASSSAQCEELVALAAERGLTLMVGHTFLYSAVVRKIKQIIDAGDLGKLRYISSRRLNLGLFQKDINVVWDLAPHDISIISYLMNETPCAVNCQGHAHVTDGTEDVATLTMRFPSGGFATTQTSWLDPKKVREMTIVGSRRMIVYDDLEPMEKIRIYDSCVETPPHYDTFAEFHYSYHHGDMYAPRIDQGEALGAECRHFLDCIQTGQEPMTSGVQGLKLIRVLEAASESLRRDGACVEVSTRERDRAAVAPRPPDRAAAGAHHAATGTHARTQPVVAAAS
jgi:predicted dehydrogenase